jgi:TrmH family RNA methyltransferase
MIVSRQNERVKQIRALKQKKFRTESGLYLVEGVKSVVEVLKSTHQVVTVVGTGETLGKIPSDLLMGVEAIEVSNSVFESISDEVTPQGVLAVVKMPKYELTSPKNSCILSDGVSDPGNIGAIIRTAAASGYTEVYFINSADPYSPKAVRSSMSGLFKVKTYFGDRDSVLKAIDCPLVVATMEGESVFTYNAPEKFCLVIGNEANGVSDEVKKIAEQKVSIPMQNGVESLNASVSAGILMYLLKK